MSTTYTYTLAIIDHQFNEVAHDVVTVGIPCTELDRGRHVDTKALDAALAQLRRELIKSVLYEAEVAEGVTR